MGMLRWLCELGRVDLLYESALLATYMAMPRLGHLQQALKVFYYPNHNIKTGWLVFDPYDYNVNWNPIRPNEMPLPPPMKELKQCTNYIVILTKQSQVTCQNQEVKVCMLIYLLTLTM